MIDKGQLPGDPRGLIFESYRIDGITQEECRSIFFDWAMSMPMGDDMVAHLNGFIAAYGPDNPDHPMTDVLREGLARANQPTGRRGGRARNAK